MLGAKTRKRRARHSREGRASARPPPAPNRHFHILPRSENAETQRRKKATNRKGGRASPRAVNRDATTLRSFPRRMGQAGRSRLSRPLPRPPHPSRPFCMPPIANKRICSGLTANARVSGVSREQIRLLNAENAKRQNGRLRPCVLFDRIDRIDRISPLAPFARGTVSIAPVAWRFFPARKPHGRPRPSAGGGRGKIVVNTKKMTLLS